MKKVILCFLVGVVIFSLNSLQATAEDKAPAFQEKESDSLSSGDIEEIKKFLISPEGARKIIIEVTSEEKVISLLRGTYWISRMEKGEIERIQVFHIGEDGGGIVLPKGIYKLYYRIR